MLVAETVLGNVETDPEWTARYEARPDAEVERVVLDDRDRRRSRVRTTTDAGTDVGIVVADDRRLEPGDVLVADEQRLVVVAFERRDALIVTLDDEYVPTTTAFQLAALGYRVGNRHWDLAVRDGEVLVALGTDADRKVEAVTAALPEGARTRREPVDPTLFDDTGHGPGAAHTHGQDSHGHGTDGHSHGDGPDSHSHGDGDDHDHDPDPGRRRVSTDEDREVNR